MASNSQAVTPAGIRDGDPAALGALVERRANAVLSYCEAVCPPRDAERAAAEAFARFRAAVASADDPRTLDPETLLLGATRHAAASLTEVPTPAATGPGLRRRIGGSRSTGASETCALVPDLLAARAEGALGAADQERLARHLERHPACRSLSDSVELAERCYASPSPRTVPISALTEIMLAFAAAAPITAAPQAELDFTEVVPAEPAIALESPVEQAVAPPPETPVALPEPPASSPEPPAAAAIGLPEPPPPFPEPPAVVEPPAPALPEPPYAVIVPPEPPAVATALPEPPAANVDQQYRYEQGTAEVAQPTMVLPALPLAAGTGAAATGGVAHPRPPGRDGQRAGSAGEHGVVYRYVLPGASVAVALLAAMGVAGFFSADAPRARSVPPSVPSAPPAGAPPVAPETNVDAEERAVLAAERRARRERAAAAERRRKREAAAAASPSTVPEATTPAVVPSVPDPEPAPAPAAAPRTPEKASTAEKEPPAESSSALPESSTTTEPSADPGVFEGTPTPTP